MCTLHPFVTSIFMIWVDGAGVLVPPLCSKCENEEKVSKIRSLGPLDFRLSDFHWFIVVVSQC